MDEQLRELKPTIAHESKVHGRRSVYFEGGRVETEIYKLEDLTVGDLVNGPAILADGTQTVVVPPGSSAILIETHVVINVGDNAVDSKMANALDVDPILLSIFSHRFMAIAEQMGRALQKTSVSTNVKERLDFSCALFDADGGLVANGIFLHSSTSKC